MLNSFKDIYQAVANSERKKTISVAMADDAVVLTALKEVEARQIARTLLVGNQEKIIGIASEIGYNIDRSSIIHETDPEIAAAKAVSLVHSGQADILMKGHISTPVIMKAVLDKDTGLRTGEVLSHVAVSEMPTWPKLMLISDGGINIYPDMNTKASILRNMLKVTEKLLNPQAKIGILCPIEKVNPKIPETVDAEGLANQAAKGEFGNALIEGPIAIDVALSKIAAERKDIDSKISGDIDGLLVPNLTTGNALLKSTIYLAKANVGGVVLGARVPVILLSRADDPIQKMNSIALAIQCC